jgi:hypothetical protein
MSELQLIYDKLDGACCPEDIFGSGDDPAVVFKKLARACHPDAHPLEPIAVKAFQIVGGVDGIAVSHLDYLPRLGWQESVFLEKINELAPVVMEGRGPTAAHRTINLEVAA